MLLSQIAGRHGSYATQFWRSSGAPRYHNRAGMRIAYSRKAINRRLVLPLDSHNWMRSLEVLNAGYARLGRTPQHYQAVLRDMVEHHGAYAELKDSTPATLKKNQLSSDAEAVSSTHSTSAAAASVLPAIDSLRAKAYAGEIPSNVSLWVTLVWSYCALQRPQEALDAFHQARRRFQLSVLTLQHMAELLLPLLCRHGQLDEATSLYEEFLKPNAATTAPCGSPLPADTTGRSKFDDAEARRWLAEAAAHQGDWKNTLLFAATAVGVEDNTVKVGAAKGEMTTAGLRRPTINSLFRHPESSATNTQSSPSATTQLRENQTRLQQHDTTLSKPPRSSSSTPPALSTLSPSAVRHLFHSLCREAATAASTATTATVMREGEPNFVADALACWEHLYGPLPTASVKTCAGTNSNATTIDPPKRQTPPLRDVHELLNLQASCGRWEALLCFFSVVFLHRPSSVYLTATPYELRNRKDGITAAVASYTDNPFACETAPASFFPYEEDLPLDEVTLNLVFASLPRATEPLRLCTSPAASKGSSEGLTLPASARPVTVVRLLDDLLTYRDDMMLTDIVMAAVGPALLQVGQNDRAFELLVRTPMMVRARERKAALQLSSYQNELKSVLVSVGYAAYALCRSEAQRLEMVRRLPHLFPPEVVRRLATEAGSDVSLLAQGGACASSPALAALEGPVVTMPIEAAPSLEADASRTTASAAGANLSLLDRRWELYADPARTRQADEVFHATMGRAAHRRGRPSATLTSLADDAMRRDYLRLQETRHVAFTGSHTDANRDPRPIPKGLHDHASGWDFFGRGGEKVFANHKRTPHPLTMRPKVMRDLRNAYRGWNPRQNSSLAHKENVIKWNGKSAV
ncbi:hypothetical protein ABL78_5128 [Leptomonas seymouri]|uniref:Uncharacterized protein n=1 Tax=Leptomonas seymouri TaxID=5684 RepID=A0A0N1IJM2_LEPSE|nr:hypothetical protein ABL78_5128 [Leptomonas seymouri]|eukprot:KPI85824.1 hypothetical protein ABL78_5128 [Leptomonas seymouri]